MYWILIYLVVALVWDRSTFEWDWDKNQVDSVWMYVKKCWWQVVFRSLLILAFWSTLFWPEGNELRFCHIGTQIVMRWKYLLEIQHCRKYIHIPQWDSTTDIPSETFADLSKVWMIFYAHSLASIAVLAMTWGIFCTGPLCPFLFCHYLSNIAFACSSLLWFSSTNKTSMSMCA